VRNKSIYQVEAFRFGFQIIKTKKKTPNRTFAILRPSIQKEIYFPKWNLCHFWCEWGRLSARVGVTGTLPSHRSRKHHSHTRKSLDYDEDEQAFVGEWSGKSRVQEEGGRKKAPEAPGAKIDHQRTPQQSKKEKGKARKEQRLNHQIQHKALKIFRGLDYSL